VQFPRLVGCTTTLLAVMVVPLVLPVKLDLETLSTVPEDPPAAGPEWALDPPLPGTRCADVAEIDEAVVVAPDPVLAVAPTMPYAPPAIAMAVAAIAMGLASRCENVVFRTFSINFPVLQTPLEPATFWRVAVRSELDRRDPDTEVRRRTWLAAERTWLAWWRTGLGSAAVAVGVGRLVPGLTDGAAWPLKLLGIGYGGLAIAILVIGAVRERRVSAALRRGGYHRLSSPLVTWLTIAGVGLSLVTLGVIAFAHN